MPTTATKMTNCPLCRLPMAQVGRLVAADDAVRQNFAFSICLHCVERLERLPLRLQGRQMDVAISNLEKHPERYEIRFFESEEAALLYVRLEADSYRHNILRFRMYKNSPVRVGRFGTD